MPTNITPTLVINLVTDQVASERQDSCVYWPPVDWRLKGEMGINLLYLRNWRSTQTGLLQSSEPSSGTPTSPPPVNDVPKFWLGNEEISWAWAIVWWGIIPLPHCHCRCCPRLKWAWEICIGLDDEEKKPGFWAEIPVGCWLKSM